MEIALTIFITLLGVAVGSFLNVCIDRLPAGKSLVTPPSHCDACQRRLAAADLVPLVSYLWLRGRCRYCGARIPLRSPLVEVSSGGLFFLACLQFILSGPVNILGLAVTALFGCIFLIILYIDWEHQLILNRVTYPAAAMALVVSLFYHPWAWWPEITLPWPGLAAVAIGLASSFVGGLAGFIFLLIPALINPKGMGFGDIKMAGLIGLVVGFPMVLVALFMGVVSGGLAAIFLLLFRIKKRKEVIPFGPFLSLAAIATLLYGNEIIGWYLGLF